ncbi:MAG TPA: PAS domain S-box protein [Burkholderiales bacterium]|nr:PAS domain S-box protein [Burkholderiales bacterium]
MDSCDEHRADFQQHLVEQAPDAIIFVDSDGLVRLWNDAAERIFGYKQADVLGRGLDVIIPETLRTAHENGFRRAIDSGVTKYAGKAMTTRSLHASGRKLYVDLSFSILKDGTGKVLGALAFARDATETYAENRALKSKVVQLETELQRRGPCKDTSDTVAEGARKS